MNLYQPKGLRLRVYRCSVMFIVLLALMIPSSAQAATLPVGFAETLVDDGLSRPTAMEIAPDGRIFVCEQGGQVRVIKNGTLLPTPFLTLPVNSSGERGLLGITFDPNFVENNYVYVYYTATTPAIHNRVSRFTAEGDIAVPGSEVVIMDLDNLSSATNHNGGAIHFGPDGKLYAAVGENANGANAQSLSNRLGKMLRINADGTIPTDNPFYNTATGENRAIWSLGLRNPFTFSFQRGTGRMFINDVGQSTWEEINRGSAGANYGWPDTEGPTADPDYRGPIYAYQHDGSNCAITGGAFYNPVRSQFPSNYAGDYFFADFCGGWIRRFDPVDRTVTDFATGISSPVDLKVATDGSLYYLAHGTGAVHKVEYTANLVANAGFELDTNDDSRPDNWSRDRHASRAAGVVHSGDYAMRHAATDNATYVVSQALPNLQAGLSYTVGGWVSIPPTTDTFVFQLLVQWRGAGDDILRNDIVESYTAPTGGWTQASQTFVAPPGTAYALVIMRPVSLTGTVFVDDVTFRP